jgi:hypothetical protein
MVRFKDSSMSIWLAKVLIFFILTGPLTRCNG